MAQTIFKIEGMTCDHCARTIQKALSGVPGVKKVEVSFPEKNATVIYEDGFNLSEAVRVVDGEGYRLVREAS